jgi:hypothetical protein
MMLLYDIYTGLNPGNLQPAIKEQNQQTESGQKDREPMPKQATVLTELEINKFLIYS